MNDDFYPLSDHARRWLEQAGDQPIMNDLIADVCLILSGIALYFAVMTAIAIFLKGTQQPSKKEKHDTQVHK